MLLFRKAYAATKREVFTSLYILLVFKGILTILLWIAESSLNSDYSLFDALVWIVVKYISDPAEIITAPVTVLGQVIGSLVGLLGIAIFAVPTGLIGAGLLDAIMSEKKEEETAENSIKLHKRFRRIKETDSYYLNAKGLKMMFRGVPRYRTFPHIKMKTGWQRRGASDKAKKTI